MITQVAVLVACHNRRDLTVAALSSLFAAAKAAGVEVHLVLFDDGSTDGTAEAVDSLCTDVPHTIIRGDGSAYWARSMATAETFALSAPSRFDAILWLNDDVVLDEDSLVRAVALHRARPQAILVGPMREPASGVVSYSGYVAKKWHPLRLRMVSSTGQVAELDTFHGNFVLVPMDVAEVIGGIDGNFAHGMADIDYGFRARDAGFDVLLLPAPVGSCANRVAVRRGTVLEQWREFRTIKGGGHGPTMRRFLRKRSPRWWFVYALFSHLSWWLKTACHAAREGFCAQANDGARR